jgi:hypothetical protein
MSSTNSHSSEKAEPKGEAIVSRIAEIENSLVRESWLPISLRGLLATELPQMMNLVRAGGRLWRPRVAKQLLVLSLATWVYGPSPLESETVSQMQALELEVNGSSVVEKELER